jgi:hypothetical protein
MPADNNHNLLYFESPSMRELYECMEKWQVANSKRLLSVCIQRDKELFCCIALSNPTVVIISDSKGNKADLHYNRLWVYTYD